MFNTGDFVFDSVAGANVQVLERIEMWGINFDDILNQFDNIEISNNNRISADDEKFC